MEKQTIRNKGGVSSLFILFLLVEAFFVYVGLWTSSGLIAIVFLGAAIFLPIIIYNPIYIFFVLVLYISLLPNRTWGERYDFFPLYVNREFMIALLGLSFLVLLIRGLHERKWKIHVTSLDLLVGLFLFYTILNSLWGLFNNTNRYFTTNELYYILFYGVYFLARYLLNSERRVKQFISVLILASTLAALEYILLAYSELDITSLFVNRVTTQQPHLAQLSIPLLFGGILFLRKQWVKLILGLLLIPNFLMALFSQQRGLWGGILGSLLLLITLYYFRDKISFPRVVKYIFGIFGFLLALGLLLFALEYYLNLSFLLTIYERLDSLANLALDRSLHIRVTEIKQAFVGWKDWIVFGEGLGATYERIFAFRGSSGLDNTYAFIIWKLGLVGFTLYISILCVYIWQSLKLYWMTKQDIQRFIIGALLAGMIGLFAIGMTNMSMIQYRFNIIWATIIGLTQNLFLQVQSSSHD